VATTASATTPGIADTAATRLASLELRRIALLVTGDSASLPGIDAELSAQRARTRSMVGTDAAGRLMSQQVAHAIEGRELLVAERVRELRVVYADNYPTLRQALTEQRLLQARTQELLQTNP
jgi:hypothetical protein